MAITQIKGSNIEDGTVVAADIKDDSITNDKIKSDAAIAASKLATIPASKLDSTLDLSSKTVTLPAAAVTAHAVTPTLDAPVITGTLSVLDSGTVTHTIANWSDDVSYTITPTNCTAGAVNASGEFVITHTSGSPSYTIKATTVSLGLADSALVTKNITIQLSAPTLSSPADSPTATNVVYTITSTTTSDDKIILDPGTANFTFQSVSVGTASKVGNTVECIGFTTNNPAVTIQFTAEATYSVTAKSVKIDGSYGTSANSAADSILIQNTPVSLATSPLSGNEVTSGDYKIHTFISSSTLTFTASAADIEWFVLAGGGGGGGGRSNSSFGGAGGGAGGYRTGTGQAVSNVTYVITVGAGGAAGVCDTTNPDDAAASSIKYPADGSTLTIASSGGGGGATRQRGLPSGAEGNNDGHPGGSGGGGTGVDNSAEGGAGGAGNEGSYSPVEGYAGSRGGNGAGMGGGGGASETPTVNDSTVVGQPGGDGLTPSIDGLSVARGGGGGGGGNWTATSKSVAGAGGGGQGAEKWVDGSNGVVNKGGGGGGAGSSYTGGSPTLTDGGQGGSGIVIVKYRFQA